MNRLTGLFAIVLIISPGCTSYQNASDADALDGDVPVVGDINYDTGNGDADTGYDAVRDDHPVDVADAVDVNPVDAQPDSDDVVDVIDFIDDLHPVDAFPDTGDIVTGSLYYRTDLNIGHVAAGSSLQYTTLVQNVSTVPVSIGPIALREGGCQWLSVDPLEARVLAPDESVDVTGLISPDAAASAGACAGTLVLTTDIVGQAEVEINLTGQVTRPVISVFPVVSELQLPDTLPGCHSSTTLDIVNMGEGPMWIQEISFVGPSGLEIKMTGVPASMPASVPAGGGTNKVQISFDFDPVAYGDYAGILYVTSDALNTPVMEFAVVGSSRDCFDGTHKCGCVCADDSAVETCGARCEPCETTVPGQDPTCAASGETYVCGSGCADGFHACGLSCKADDDVNACGTGCAMCYARSNSTRACVGGQCALNCNQGFDDCDDVYTNGCETSLNLASDCGECDHQCTAPEHGIPTCTDMGCTFDCVGGYHPDGAVCVINDVDTCCGDNGPGGACVDCHNMQVPMPPRTTGVCVGLIDFNCEMICEDGWFSTSGGINDGCECHFVSNFDQPGNGVDEDCDGNDGEPDLAFYVSNSGLDSAAGSRAEPFRTIQKGINAAKAAFIKKRVFIAAGTYEENLVIDGSISLFGGFSTDGNWTFSASNTTTLKALNVVNGRTIAVDGSNMTTETWISGLNIVAGPASQSDNGADVYGIKCSNCSGLGIVRTVIQAGPGGNHLPTPAGAVGVTGGTGGNGSYTLFGGAPGTTACGRAGGTGGEGGYVGGGYDGTSGEVVGQGGGAGGYGGYYGSAQDGSVGAACTEVGGDSDGAKTVGSVVGGYWNGTAGTDGIAGCAGHGGGGGGGGDGYYDGDFYNYGSGGGGGGGGGCGGSSGPGGKAGGASIGIFLHNSTGATLLENVVMSADAGHGAIGGQGGAGGAGGNGGIGPYGSGGWAGDGGKGGAGSAAGYGGGGAGGVSYAIYTADTVITLPGSNVLSHGLPGLGGSTKGVKNAVDGISGDFN